ncbi:hypothetical protein F753_19350 [Stutzerimonas chloritidismutans AW-1]|uniref:Uncharacterized protein n=1 Tax=Stutzerimonas chloritidismutans AW-1 TaxID=1263865 RepID=V4Q4V7_STUCH|nr:hypothetical protein F753_19350 [Stutzerimonas chloritidismutans AW-1]
MLFKIQMLSDVLNQLHGVASVHHGEHQVAFAAGEALGTTLGGCILQLYCLSPKDSAI